MHIEAEFVAMKQIRIDISRRIDDLLDESETAALMRLLEESISELNEDEPDLYSVEDLKSDTNEGKDCHNTFPLKELFIFPSNRCLDLLRKDAKEKMNLNNPSGL